MSTADLLGTTTDPLDPAAEERRHLLHTAGLAGIGAFVLWLCQPLLVALLSSTDTDSPTVETLRSMPFNGAVEAVLFSGIATCLMVLVIATWRLIGLTTHPGTASTVGLGMGLVAASGWVWSAGDSLSMYTSVGAGLADITASPEVQAASLQASYLSVTAGLVVFTIGSFGWYVMLVTTGRRAGLVGKPLAALLGLLLLAPLAQLATPFAAPWSLVVFVLGALLLGIAMLVKSRA